MLMIETTTLRTEDEPQYAPLEAVMRDNAVDLGEFPVSADGYRAMCEAAGHLVTDHPELRAGNDVVFHVLAGSGLELQVRIYELEPLESARGLRGGGLGSPHDVEGPAHFPEDGEPEAGCPSELAYKTTDVNGAGVTFRFWRGQQGTLWLEARGEHGWYACRGLKPSETVQFLEWSRSLVPADRGRL